MCVHMLTQQNKAKPTRTALSASSFFIVPWVKKGKQAVMRKGRTLRCFASSKRDTTGDLMRAGLFGRVAQVAVSYTPTSRPNTSATDNNESPVLVDAPR